MPDRRGAMKLVSIALAALALSVRGQAREVVAKPPLIVRSATEADLPSMVELVEARRLIYARFEPVFWRKADNSAAKTYTFFKGFLSNARATALVAEDTGTGRINAFLIAIDTPSPPVYAPVGPTILIDDFCVAHPSLWQDAGRALLDHVRDIGREKGWRQIVVVSGWRDRAKQKLLRNWRLSLASTWWTAPI